MARDRDAAVEIISYECTLGRLKGSLNDRKCLWDLFGLSASLDLIYGPRISLN